jgi:hypothetical protein
VSGGKNTVSSSRACKEAFLRIIEPEILSWNLQQHPNPNSSYGGCDYGYRWDFADIRDPDDVRLTAVSIVNPGQQLIIEGLRKLRLEHDPVGLPMVWGNSGDVFRLTRKWSIRRPLDGFIFKFERRRNQTVPDSAKALMEELKGRLPRLHEYLYG